MTHLRVFEDSKNRLFIEITSPEAKLSRVLLVRAFHDGAPELAGLKRAELVRASFEGRTIFVAFLLVLSRSEEVRHKLRLAGALEETDSIDVLNNLRDVFAYSADG